MKSVEYRICPTTDYEVVKIYEDDDGSGGCTIICTCRSEDEAQRVIDAMRVSELTKPETNN